MIRTKSLLLTIILLAIILSGCKTASRDAVSVAELKQTLESYNEIDLYAATSIASLSVADVEFKIFVLERLRELDPASDYSEQIKNLKAQQLTRKEYLELLYKRVYSE